MGLGVGEASFAGQQHFSVGSIPLKYMEIKEMTNHAASNHQQIAAQLELQYPSCRVIISMMLRPLVLSNSWLFHAFTHER